MNLIQQIEAEEIAKATTGAGKEIPTFRPGDTVRVVVVPLADPVEPTPPTMLELVAEVWDVAPANEYEPTAVVTLRLPLTEAATVAGADSVRLVRVEP